MRPGRTAAEIESEWLDDPRWEGTRRDYTASDVTRLRGSVHVEHTLARRGAEKLWKLVSFEPCCPRTGRADGQPGGANGRGGPASHLSQRLAGGGRRQ